MEDMQGTLWKWTNYFTGWQPRWFVLESGILSYYRSQDDVNNGCKGSIKMAVCDVNVHATDNTRLDLIIPGEAHFYVKAATPQERQQWLVALGSCKACLGKGKTNDRKAEDVSNDSELRGKRSELRLYCDLLMQQVHSVKDAITLPEGALPEVQKIDEATSLLSATCDTFINTLEQCMMLAQASASSSPAVPLSGSGSTDPAVPSSPARNKSALKTSNPWGPIQRSTSIDSYNFRGGSVSPSSCSSHAMLTPDIVFGYIPNNARGQRTSSKSSASRSRTPSESSELSGNEQKTTLNNNGHVSLPRMSLDSGDVAEVDSDGQTNVQTYFTVMQTSFMDIQLQGDAGIPVVQFLNACQPVLQVFDKLNATAFAPIKLDVAGNIRKIKQKYSSNPEKFVTLQDIVQYEMNNHQHHLSHSATIALLWLKRSLQFIREFMHGILSTRDELDVVANNAYVLTLKQYHSLVVRGVFALAVKAIPYRADFLALFAISDNDLQSPDFERSLMNDIDAYITALDVILRILNDFYTSNGIDSQEQI